jgi:hypothetical protein
MQKVHAHYPTDFGQWNRIKELTKEEVLAYGVKPLDSWENPRSGLFMNKGFILLLNAPLDGNWFWSFPTDISLLANLSAGTNALYNHDGHYYLITFMGR